MSNPYISIEDALEMIPHEKTVLLDCRWFLDGRDARAIYLEGHIPGARFLDMEKVAADLSIENAGRHPLPSVGNYCKAIGALGVTKDSTVILYDSDAGTIAARVWWMNRQLSIQSHIVTGGIQSYTGALETGESNFEGNTLECTRVDWENTINTDELIEYVSNNPNTIILDARNEDRYLGTFEPVDPRAGHIPSAYNLPTRSLMLGGSAPAPKETVKQRMIDLIGAEGFDSVVCRDAQVVVSCGSSVTACHLAIFIEEATGRPPLLYNGSFSAWSSRFDLPIQGGKDRGTFPSL